MSSTPTPRERPRRRTAALLASAATLIALAVGQTPSVAEVRAIKMTVSIKAPTSVVKGDPVVVRGKVETRRAADLKLQGRTSRTTRWRTLDTGRTSGRYRFQDVPTKTTWYRVVATRKSQRVRSRTVKVVVSDPVYRWFDLYDLGTSGGDPDGYWMDYWISSNWYDQYGDEGFTSEVDALDPADWTTFDLDRRCDRVTGALGAEANEGTAQVRVAGDGTVLVDRAFGDAQWQQLELDVTGVQQLRVDLTSLGGGYLTSHLLGWRVHCDSRFTARPKDTDNRRWLPLFNRGTDGGDPDGFAQDYWISSYWYDQYGDEGFSAEVSDTDVEDWTEFVLPAGCTHLNTAVGATGDGQVDLRISDQDGATLYRRELGDEQWAQVDLDLREVSRLRVTATSLDGPDSSVYLLGPAIYCRRG